MAEDEPCHICGNCWWTGCNNPADYTINTPGIRHKGHFIPVGDIDLCAGHARYAQRRHGRLDLDWKAVEQALAKHAAKS